MERIVIGRKDLADLPLFNLKNIPVKIDTGAYSSSIHCDVIDLIEEPDKRYLQVTFFETPKGDGEKIMFEKFIEKPVKSSNGEIEIRYIVQGNIILFGKTYKTAFSLTTRAGMRYPVLLGRKLLNRKFVIDPSKINLSAEQLKTSVFIR